MVINAKFMNILRIIIFLTLAISIAGFAYAHGLGGGQDKVVGNYLIDLSYSPEEPVAGQNIQFGLSLLDNETKEIADFENAWVRISKGNEVLFASTLERTTSNVASFLYTFTESGVYETTVRFQKFNEEIPEIRLAEIIVETDFNIVVGGDVAARKSRASKDLIIGFIIGAILGIIISLILRRKVK